ncbi:MAG: prenyltransferase [Caldisericia bacterium]
MTEKKKVPFGVWIAEMRPEFFTATAMTVIVTCAMIWSAFGTLNWLNAILTVLATVTANFATNAANDYWDHVSGCDEKNETPVRPFTGGSRLIQSGALTQKEFSDLQSSFLLSLLQLVFISILFRESGHLLSSTWNFDWILLHSKTD